jgi:hypothetical protein
VFTRRITQLAATSLALLAIAAVFAVPAFASMKQGVSTCGLSIEPMSSQPAEVRAKTYVGATRARVYTCNDESPFYHRFIQPMNQDDSVSFPILYYSVSPNTNAVSVSETGFWATDNGDAINWWSTYTGTLIVEWQYDTPDRQHVVSSGVANAATQS